MCLQSGTWWIKAPVTGGVALWQEWGQDWAEPGAGGPKAEAGGVAGEHLSLVQNSCFNVSRHMLVLESGKICFSSELNQIKDSVNLQLASGKRLPL